MVNQKKPEKPKITFEEEAYRKKIFPDVKEARNKNWLCTSCGGSVQKLIAKGKPISHPFMETLLCEKCKSFYGDGDFSEDDDGLDKYCRWCGQGGTLFLCSSCTAGFCKKCVKRNLPRSALADIENDDWVCYCCNPKPLYDLRAQCWAAQQFATEYVNKSSRSRSKPTSSKDSSVKEKRKRNSSSDDTEENHRKMRKVKTNSDEPIESKKRNRMEDIETSKKKSHIKGKQKDTKIKDKKVDDAKLNQFKEGVDILVRVSEDYAKASKQFHKKVLDFLARKADLKHVYSLESWLNMKAILVDITASYNEINEKIAKQFTEASERWEKSVTPAIEDAKETLVKSKSEESKIKNGIVNEENKMEDTSEASVSEVTNETMEVSESTTLLAEEATCIMESESVEETLDTTKDVKDQENETTKEPKESVPLSENEQDDPKNVESTEKEEEASSGENSEDKSSRETSLIVEKVVTTTPENVDTKS